MECLFPYFPDLSDTQRRQLAALGGLYAEWNAKINVISRRDIDGLYEHHVLHSLAIARFVTSCLEGGWPDGTRIVDVGTGGGFPGIPLAILFPGCRFLLVDRIGKKVRVAAEVAAAIGLSNVEVRHAGIEEVREALDYAVSRAVMPLPDLLRASRRAYSSGLICLKGGALDAELSGVRGVQRHEISAWFAEPYFAEKQVIYVPREPSRLPHHPAR